LVVIITVNLIKPPWLTPVDHGGISERSDFASRIKDTYLSFTLNCRSDYLVAYPQKKQKTYETKLSRMKLTF
jgi:hypothetical protein